MLDISFHPDRRIFEVRCSDKLEQKDFEELRKRIDPLLQKGEPFAGILIDGPSFPGWKDLKSLSEHIRFVRDHHKVIPKIAFVMEGAWADTVPTLANDFVETEVRRFDPEDREEAERWLHEPKESF
ncbi:MAG: STAS/SEC14 domain-containing protein [Opitutales bacterium]